LYVNKINIAEVNHSLPFVRGEVERDFTGLRAGALDYW
jgi:hypothetical protein